MNGVSQGTGELVSGLAQLNDNYATFDAAVGTLADTVSGMSANVSALKSGIDQLTASYTQLVNGSKTLKSGTSDMYQGILTLNDGTKELKDGTQEFYDQTDGMDTKIEDTMNEMLDSLSGGDSETTSFVSEKNGNIDSVQFVIKTDAIEKKEKAKKTKEKTEETFERSCQQKRLKSSCGENEIAMSCKSCYNKRIKFVMIWRSYNDSDRTLHRKRESDNYK